METNTQTISRKCFSEECGERARWAANNRTNSRLRYTEACDRHLGELLSGGSHEVWEIFDDEVVLFKAYRLQSNPGGNTSYLDPSRELKLVSDGTSRGTRVLGPEDEEIEGVKSVTLIFRPGTTVECVLELMAIKLDVVIPPESIITEEGNGWSMTG